jgi:NAD(P)-dependent dehydrogenase (short-subunit alcohol dehydrogenase family)
MSEEVIGAGKVAVVTGAASGIGRALAEALARDGSAVVIADHDTEHAQEVERSIRDAGGDALAVSVDVSELAAVERLAATVVDRYGRVDVLCNNAGVSTFNLMRDQSIDEWRWVVDVNFWGVVHGLHTFLPIMRAQGTPGHVVNTASIGGLLTGSPVIGPYCATKAAVVSVSETLAQELAVEQVPIGVSVLCPSSVDTRMMESDRNRPAALGLEQRTEMAEAWHGMIKDGLTGPTGQSPAQVAERVLHAIRNGEFWIITHDDLLPTVRNRVEGMLAAFPGGGV